MCAFEVKGIKHQGFGDLSSRFPIGRVSAKTVEETRSLRRDVGRRHRLVCDSVGSWCVPDLRWAQNSLILEGGQPAVPPLTEPKKGRLFSERKAFHNWSTLVTKLLYDEALGF